MKGFWSVASEASRRDAFAKLLPAFELDGGVEPSGFDVEAHGEGVEELDVVGDGGEDQAEGDRGVEPGLGESPAGGDEVGGEDGEAEVCGGGPVGLDLGADGALLSVLVKIFSIRGWRSAASTSAIRSSIAAAGSAGVQHHIASAGKVPA